MTTPLKVKRRTINNYAETIDVNWDCPRQTRVSCRPPYWYLNWPPNLKHSLIVVKLFMGAGGGAVERGRVYVCVCVCARACTHAQMDQKCVPGFTGGWGDYRSSSL